MRWGIFVEFFMHHKKMRFVVKKKALLNQIPLSIF